MGTNLTKGNEPRGFSANVNHATGTFSEELCFGYWLPSGLQDAGVHSCRPPGHTQASWLLPCPQPWPQPQTSGSRVPLERQNELCLEIVFETFMTLGMITDAGVTGEYLFYELPKPAGGFPSLGTIVVLVKVERSRFYCRLRLTSPHGCNVLWDLPWQLGEHKSCESQPASRRSRLGLVTLFSVRSVKGSPRFQPRSPR